MRSLFLVALLACASLFVLPGQAAGGCYSTSAPTQVVDASGSTYYLFVDKSPSLDLYVYQETNGLGGAQRHDAHVNDVAGCTDGTVADTRLF